MKESASSMKSSLESEMDKREADLQSTPEQKLEKIQTEINDDPFTEVRNRIEGKQAHADARDELASHTGAAVTDAEAEAALKDLAGEVADDNQG